MTKTTTYYTKDAYSVTYTCSHCNYTYEIENANGKETVIDYLPHHGSKAFSRTINGYCHVNNRLTPAYIYTCPQCLMVQFCNEEVYNDEK